MNVALNRWKTNVCDAEINASEWNLELLKNQKLNSIMRLRNMLSKSEHHFYFHFAPFYLYVITHWLLNKAEFQLPGEKSEHFWSSNLFKSHFIDIHSEKKLDEHLSFQIIRGHSIMQPLFFILPSLISVAFVFKL